MKKIGISFVVMSAILLTSCGVNSAFILNHNQNSTQVTLEENNFKVAKRVSGSSDVSYVLIFGGKNKKRLYEDAYSQMLATANLSGSQALINVLTEEHIGGFPPFYYKRTVTVSAHVVEFVK